MNRVLKGGFIACLQPSPIRTTADVLLDSSYQRVHRANGGPKYSSANIKNHSSKRDHKIEVRT
jgi:hypothetical protein